ncbi:MAG: glycosyltransferase family 39 protein [Sphingomonas sp.]|nr:glycosyltransferase family 39 protein [Sphingomonas sp.]
MHGATAPLTGQKTKPVPTRLFAALGLLALLGAAVWIGWIGFIASDDSLYFYGAERWLTAPPFAGDNHWTTRFPLLWSFAAMLLVFGKGFAAFAATALLWYAVLIAVVGLFVQRLAGDRAGWIAALLVGTMPVIVGNATTVSVDLIEAALLVGGGWLLGQAGCGPGAWRGGFLAGLCFGTAIVCRETALLSMLAFGPLFLIGRPVSRQVMIAAGVGLVTILGGEALFQFWQTGVPLRRYDIAFHHDSHIDRAANMEGNFLLHPAIDPLLVLLINDDFGLIFWVAALAVGAGGASFWRGAKADPLIVLTAMAAADFLLVAVLVNKLVLNPRYFTLPAIVAVVIAALWLARCGPRLRWMVVGAIVASNLMLMSVGNAHPRWAMESLIAACRSHPGEHVSGDPVSVRRARLSMRFLHLANARYAPAPAGGLLVVPADQAPAGTVLARYPSPPTRLGSLLRATGLEPHVPQPIRHRMFAPNPTMLLVRTSPER